MLYMSNSRISRQARRWAWANRPFESIDSPVKRYLRERPVNSTRMRRFQRVFGRMSLRPAF